MCISNRSSILLKELLTRSSKMLYNATNGRAYFRRINIIVPSSWSSHPSYHILGQGSFFQSAHIRVDWPNPRHGDEPFTEQLGGCGEPGRYIQLTPEFLSTIDDHESEDTFGPPDKVLVREWARYRYGVFPEHGVPGSLTSPTFQRRPNKKIVPNTCVYGIKGWFQTKTGQRCKVYNNGQDLDPNCEFVPDPNATTVKASLLFSPKISSVSQWDLK